MNKRVSLIIAMESASVHDLAVPLSSINNQLGVDFREIEVLLIDNGRYQLEDLEPLRVFNHLTFRYIKPAKIWSWANAFQQGVMLATGKYVAFLGPNFQFNAVDVLQQVLQTITAHPEAQLISGLLMRQEMNDDRSYAYKVESANHLLSGRFINRNLLMQSQIKFEDFGVYTEQYVGQQIEAVAQAPRKLESVVAVQFMGRALPETVLPPQPETLQLEWVRMMTRFLTRLRNLAPDQYVPTLAKTIVRFYSQAGGDAAMTAQMAELTAVHAEKWPQIMAFVDDLRVSDLNPAAPWNAAPSRFNAYLQRISPLTAHVSVNA